MTAKVSPSTNVQKAIRDAFFRSDRYRIRQNQNLIFGFDPGVSFVENESDLKNISVANNSNL